MTPRTLPKFQRSARYPTINPLLVHSAIARVNAEAEIGNFSRPAFPLVATAMPMDRLSSGTTTPLSYASNSSAQYAGISPGTSAVVSPAYAYGNPHVNPQHAQHVFDHSASAVGGPVGGIHPIQQTPPGLYNYPFHGNAGHGLNTPALYAPQTAATPMGGPVHAPAFVNASASTQSIDYDFLSNSNAIISRYIKVQPPQFITASQREEVYETWKTSAPFNDAICGLGVAGTSIQYFSFDDVNSATDALCLVNNHYGSLGWTADYISYDDWKLCKPQNNSRNAMYDGEIVIEVMFTGYMVLPDDYMETNAQVADYDIVAERFAKIWGNARNIESSYRQEDPFIIMSYRIEFEKISSATRAYRAWKIDNKPLISENDLVFEVRCGLQADMVKYGTAFPGDIIGNGNLNGNGMPTHVGHLPMRHDPHTSTVDLNRIANGEDVRTTVMLRNIPNKLTHHELRSLIDESSFGFYDLIYLRVDFRNGCNVGYAFINFVSPTAMIPFVEQMTGYHWGEFNSDKVAQVYYATVQGYEALVTKYRNSQVSQEWAWLRPKLFKTFTNINDVGKEIPLPPPDNMAKLQRSRENARNVGLFSPGRDNAAQDPRARGGNYDRGIPRAINSPNNASSGYAFPLGHQFSSEERIHNNTGVIGSGYIARRPMFHMHVQPRRH